MKYAPWAVVILALAGCQPAPSDAPPALRPGRDLCAGCGMLVGEGRCAAGALLERDGEKDYATFDDLGCLFDFDRDHPEGTKVLRLFARDHAEETWIPAEAATFLAADRERLRTPMGSGIVAFRDPASARAMQASVGGDLMPLDQARAARRAWLWKQYGSNDPANP